MFSRSFCGSGETSSTRFRLNLTPSLPTLKSIPPCIQLPPLYSWFSCPLQLILLHSIACDDIVVVLKRLTPDRETGKREEVPMKLKFNFLNFHAKKKNTRRTHAHTHTYVTVPINPFQQVEM